MKPGKSLLVPIFLVGLPLWLAASAGIGLWIHFESEKDRALEQQSRFARAVSIPSIEDDLRKLVTLIGERNASSEAAATSLSRASSMIQGLLGPSNMGYTVQRHRGPTIWPLIQTTLPGTDGKAPPVWVLASYDSPAGSRGAELNASGVAATLAAAQALANAKTPAAIHFLFIPHLHDPRSLVAETLELARAVIARQPAPHAVLCIETMGTGEPLWLTPLDANTQASSHLQGLGSVISADLAAPGGQPHLAKLLGASGLPTSRIATGPIPAPGTADDRPPFAPTIAAATGRLIELIQRCAGIPAIPE